MLGPERCPEVAPSLHLPAEEMGNKGEHLDGAVTGNKATGPCGAIPRVGSRPGHVAESCLSTIQPGKPCLVAWGGNGASALLGDACCPFPPAGSLQDKKPKLPEDML